MKYLFEAVLDRERLALITHLSTDELSISELATQSNINQNDVLRHLDVLKSANLVIMHDRDGQQVYRFNYKHLEHIKRQRFAKTISEPRFAGRGFSEENQKILKDYTLPDGSLRMIPTKSKKIAAVLDYLVQSFEMDVIYKESEVNEILDRFYPDPTTLRRYLVDYGYLGRSKDGAQYWLADTLKSDRRKI
jgi:hypothetical protein